MKAPALNFALLLFNKMCVDLEVFFFNEIACRMESYIVAITKQFFQINLTITDVPSDPVLILFGLSFKMYLFSCVYFPQFENLSCIFIKILRVFDIQKIHLRLEDLLDRIVATCYMTLFWSKSFRSSIMIINIFEYRSECMQ